MTDHAPTPARTPARAPGGPAGRGARRPGAAARGWSNETWMYSLLVGVAGYLTATWQLSPLMLLAFPVADVIGTFAQRRAAVRAADVRHRELSELHAQLAEAQHVAETASLRAQRASEGLVKAAELATRNEEDVRALIVADLHDTVAQTLVAVNYLQYDPNVSATRIAALATAAETQLRDIMVAQRPLAGRLTSLADAVHALVEDLRERAGLVVDVRWTPESVALSHAAGVVLYRFAGEALANVVKHSGVDHASLRFAVDGDMVVLEVADAGAGFEESLLRGTARLGLALVKHRAEMLGGRFEVRSSPGRGTRVTFSVPHHNSAVAAL